MSLEQLAAVLPPALRKRVLLAAKQHPDTEPIFRDLILHHAPQPALNDLDSDPAAADDAAESYDELAYDLVVPGISFQNPRKKLDLALSDDDITLVESLPHASSSLPTPSSTGLASPARKTTRYSIDSLQIGFCLPTPMKQKPHSTFFLIFKSDIISFGAEDLVVKPLEYKNKGHSYTLAKGDSLRKLLVDYLSAALEGRCAGFFSVDMPDLTTFVPGPSSGSSLGSQPCPPPGVVAHIGVKDGFLYLLKRGILFAFRKPAIWIPVEAISAAQPFVVGGKSFNLLISTHDHPKYTPVGIDAGKTEVEFSLIDIQQQERLMGYFSQNVGRTRPSPAAGSGAERRSKAPLTIAHGDLGDSEEEDEDYVALSEDEVDEEFDSHHETDSERESEGEDDDRGTKKATKIRDAVQVDAEGDEQDINEEEDEDDEDADEEADGVDDDEGSISLNSEDVDDDEDDEGEDDDEDDDDDALEEVGTASPSRKRSKTEPTLDQQTAKRVRKRPDLAAAASAKRQRADLDVVEASRHEFLDVDEIAESNGQPLNPSNSNESLSQFGQERIEQSRSTEPIECIEDLDDAEEYSECDERNDKNSESGADKPPQDGPGALPSAMMSIDMEMDDFELL
ncbi:uncharacterized protein BJ171DRAFT_598323 [Polychytrium aggregatum]|uniref:uncharacterized protein n=1 Tax=Polychytrium aggregatum TaxID=110093 RepID=UPI0022FF2201|nr:uncharacterized protein BJ171DRAFT_598323 [Polychytrium aggregatum]KAI9205662.1 hypothetical protein BJ171DRAFT_598323 [Polychytrium aggregatum]